MRPIRARSKVEQTIKGAVDGSCFEGGDVDIKYRINILSTILIDSKCGKVIDDGNDKGYNQSKDIMIDIRRYPNNE